MSDRILIGTGKPPEDESYRELGESGQQRDYIVLSKAERDKGFVRPVRLTYIHEVCGTETRMSKVIAETYARQPDFYTGTFCIHCRKHYPVGANGQFVWLDGTKVGT